ncbi:hypothetical protein ABPG75_002985 [Micractinium tetrahymenae]
MLRTVPVPATVEEARLFVGTRVDRYWEAPFRKWYTATVTEINPGSELGLKGKDALQFWCLLKYEPEDGDEEGDVEDQSFDFVFNSPSRTRNHMVPEAAMQWMQAQQGPKQQQRGAAAAAAAAVKAAAAAAAPGWGAARGGSSSQAQSEQQQQQQQQQQKQQAVATGRLPPRPRPQARQEEEGPKVRQAEHKAGQLKKRRRRGSPGVGEHSNETEAAARSLRDLSSGMEAPAEAVAAGPAPAAAPRDPRAAGAAVQPSIADAVKLRRHKPAAPAAAAAAAAGAGLAARQPPAASPAVPAAPQALAAAAQMAQQQPASPEFTTQLLPSPSPQRAQQAQQAAPSAGPDQQHMDLLASACAELGPEASMSAVYEALDLLPGCGGLTEQDDFKLVLLGESDTHRQLAWQELRRQVLRGNAASAASWVHGCLTELRRRAVVQAAGAAAAVPTAVASGLGPDQQGSMGAVPATEEQQR